MATYGKTYASEEGVFEGRFQIFRENLRKIEEHDVEDSGFELGLNQFSDLSEEEFQGLYLGLKLPQRQKLQSQYNNVFLATEPREHHVVNAANLPEEVNWFAEGKVTSPYDQGSCGGCWAFATASTLESLAMINGLYEQIPEFSV